MRAKDNIEFISTWGLKRDWSYRGEEFIYIPLTWKLGVSNIEALKIRIAKWRPKYNRSNQALIYYEVNTQEQAQVILNSYVNFNFKHLEKRFDELYERDRGMMMNTGDTCKWLLGIIPILRNEFLIIT